MLKISNVPSPFTRIPTENVFFVFQFAGYPVRIGVIVKGTLYEVLDSKAGIFLFPAQFDYKELTSARVYSITEMEVDVGPKDNG